MDVIELLTVIGYTVTIFSFGYALGRERSYSLRNCDGLL